MTITRREFMKKSGVLAGAGLVGAAIVPVATGTAIEHVPAYTVKAAPGKILGLSGIAAWAKVPDHIKAQLTEANFAQFTINYDRSVPEWDDVPIFVSATIEFRWIENSGDE